MNEQEIAFDFQLSPAELHWLAGVFGLTRLPLPEDPLRYMPASQQKTELEKAITSLQARGLVSQTSTGYQIDQLTATVVKWLGSAANMWVLDVHIHSGIALHAQVFLEEGVSMHVSLVDGQLHFLFLPDRRAMSTYLLAQLGASFLDPKPAPAKYVFSQPLTVLRAAWTDPLLAAKMLKVTGLKPEEIKPLLAWAESLEWVAALTRVQIEAKEAGEASQAFLCGNRRRCWAGRAGRNSDELVTLSSIRIEEVRTLIESILQN